MAEPAAHPLTAAEAAAYGLTPGDLSDWAPLTPVQIHWARKHALTPAVARQWAREGLHVGDAVRAVALAMTPADTRRWAAAHFAPSDAVEAAEMGISLDVAIAWREAGFILPDAALLIHDGWTLDEATAARYADIATGIREDEDHDGLFIPHDHPERPPHPLARPHDAPFR